MGVRLPPEYQEVEYIHTNGNQRIRTNVYSSGAVLETEAKLSYDNARLTAQRTILHAASAGNSSVIFLASLNNETKYGVYTDASGWLNFGSITPYGTVRTVKTVIDVVGKTLRGFVDGQLSDEVTFRNNITNKNNRLWVLTYVNPADTKTTAERFHGNIYYIKFTEDGVVKMHLIPCYRKSDNVIGFYDIVNNTFYNNNQGTGSFTKGPDVFNVIGNTSPWLMERRRVLMGNTPKWKVITIQNDSGDYSNSAATQVQNTLTAAGIDRFNKMIFLKSAAKTRNHQTIYKDWINNSANSGPFFRYSNNAVVSNSWNSGGSYGVVDKGDRFFVIDPTIDALEYDKKVIVSSAITRTPNAATFFKDNVPDDGLYFAYRKLDLATMVHYDFIAGFFSKSFTTAFKAESNLQSGIIQNWTNSSYGINLYAGDTVYFLKLNI